MILSFLLGEGGKVNGLNVAGEVVGAATALAGLILVYLGSIAASYASYETTQQGSVRLSHQRRIWLAFIGFVFALSSSALAVVGKWIGSECSATIAVILLFIAFIWGIASALMTVLEVR
ncbi:MAG: hypothetical protein ACM3ZV_05335 [Bacillota bacterium]|jgi:hypothetical protein